MHDEEAAGDLALGLGSFAIGRRGVTDAAMKKRDERTEALKANFETDVSYTQIVFTEQFLRFLDATADEVLMRGLIESLPEQTQEMITRKAGLF